MAMKANSWLKSLTLALGIIFVSGMSWSDQAYAKTCKTGHFHNGYSGQVTGSKSKARKAALKGWASFTAWEYGNAWASWSRASQKKITCDRMGAKIWQCFAKGIPCRR